MTLAGRAPAEHRDRTTTGDSLAVAVWTLVSRVTGVVKIAAIGAVLGASYLGNAYQFTNALPNLLYFGLLAGSLFSSLLVPSLVAHGSGDVDDGPRAERISGGFLGVTLVAVLGLVPVALLLGPLGLRAATGAGGAEGSAQETVGRWLIVMFLPQLFLYAVVGTASAAMNARRRFALAAAAPALENVGTVAVLVACALWYGTGADVTSVPDGELLLLGAGTTGAVALHAAAQWWGAKRAGILLVPRAGWRDPDVRAVVRRALPSLAQAGLMAAQVVALLIVANRVAGGVVAFQIALNFYFLAIALAATPVALSLLPRLSRMHVSGDHAQFRDTLVQGYALALFLAVPAAAACAGLAVPLARAVAFGRMHDGGGVGLVAGTLAALSLAVVAQTVFLVSTYACYARKDTRTPLRSMVVQAAATAALVGGASQLHGRAVLVALGLGYGAALAAAAGHLALALRRTLAPGRVRLGPSLRRTVLGAAIMLVPAVFVAAHAGRLTGSAAGPRIGVLLAALTGLAVFLATQAALRTPELRWLLAGAGELVARRRSVGVRRG